MWAIKKKSSQNQGGRLTGIQPPFQNSGGGGCDLPNPPPLFGALLNTLCNLSLVTSTLQEITCNGESIIWVGI